MYNKFFTGVVIANLFAFLTVGVAATYDGKTEKDSDAAEASVRHVAYERSIQRSISLHHRVADIINVCERGEENMLLGSVDEIRLAVEKENAERGKIRSKIGTTPTLPKDLKSDYDQAYSRVVNAIFDAPIACI